MLHFIINYHKAFGRNLEDIRWHDCFEIGGKDDSHRITVAFPQPQSKVSVFNIRGFTRELAITMICVY